MHNTADNKEYIRISIDGMRYFIDGESSENFKTYKTPII